MRGLKWEGEVQGYLLPLVAQVWPQEARDSLIGELTKYPHGCGQCAHARWVVDVRKDGTHVPELRGCALGIVGPSTGDALGPVPYCASRDSLSKGASVATPSPAFLKPPAGARPGP